MKDRISAGLSPFFSGGHLVVDESHFMPMSSRYIPFPNSPTQMNLILREGWRGAKRKLTKELRRTLEA